jgi:nitrogen regulatory protein P-II 1
MKFKLIVTFVDPDLTDKVVKTAKSAGATGDVIIPARGSGIEQKSFFGLSINEKTDVILFVVEEHCVNNIIAAIDKEINLEEPGNGIAIVLSIDKVAGLSKQIKKIRENLNREEL